MASRGPDSQKKTLMKYSPKSPNKFLSKETGGFGLPGGPPKKENQLNDRRVVLSPRESASGPAARKKEIGKKQKKENPERKSGGPQYGKSSVPWDGVSESWEDSSDESVVKQWVEPEHTAALLKQTGHGGQMKRRHIDYSLSKASDGLSSPLDSNFTCSQPAATPVEQSSTQLTVMSPRTYIKSYTPPLVPMQSEDLPPNSIPTLLPAPLDDVTFLIAPVKDELPPTLVSPMENKKNIQAVPYGDTTSWLKSLHFRNPPKVKSEVISPEKPKRTNTVCQMPQSEMKSWTPHDYKKSAGDSVTASALSEVKSWTPDCISDSQETPPSSQDMTVETQPAETSHPVARRNVIISRGEGDCAPVMQQCAALRSPLPDLVPSPVRRSSLMDTAESYEDPMQALERSALQCDGVHRNFTYEITQSTYQPHTSDSQSQPFHPQQSQYQPQQSQYQPQQSQYHPYQYQPQQSQPQPGQGLLPKPATPAASDSFQNMSLNTLVADKEPQHTVISSAPEQTQVSAHANSPIMPEPFTSPARKYRNRWFDQNLTSPTQQGTVIVSNEMPPFPNEKFVDYSPVLGDRFVVSGQTDASCEGLAKNQEMEGKICDKREVEEGEICAEDMDYMAIPAPVWPPEPNNNIKFIGARSKENARLYQAKSDGKANSSSNLNPFAEPFPGYSRPVDPPRQLNPHAESYVSPEGRCAGVSCYDTTDRVGLLPRCNVISAEEAKKMRDLSPNMSDIEMYETRTYAKYPKPPITHEQPHVATPRPSMNPYIAPMSLMNVQLNAHQPPPPPEASLQLNAHHPPPPPQAPPTKQKEPRQKTQKVSMGMGMGGLLSQLRKEADGGNKWNTKTAAPPAVPWRTPSSSPIGWERRATTPSPSGSSRGIGRGLHVAGQGFVNVMSPPEASQSRPAAMGRVRTVSGGNVDDMFRNSTPKPSTGHYKHDYFDGDRCTDDDASLNSSSGRLSASPSPARRSFSRFQTPEYQTPAENQSSCSYGTPTSSSSRTPTSSPLDAVSWRSRTPAPGPLDAVTRDWKVNFQRRFEKAGPEFIDTHCHLDFLFQRSGFRGTWREYKEANPETFPPSFGGCVAIFCNPRSFHNPHLFNTLMEEEDIWGAAGCHPKSVSDYNDATEHALKRMIRHKKIRALGEIGLDYSDTHFRDQADLQKKVFIRQLNLALEAKLPLVIHCRDAEEDCIEIMEKIVPRNYRIHRHCFTGGWQEARVWLYKFPNSFIGLTPIITWRTQRAPPPREVAANMPLDRLLLETDAPYFVPKSIPRESCPFSNPGMAITVAAEVASLRNISINEVILATRCNTRNMYDI